MTNFKPAGFFGEDGSTGCFARSAFVVRAGKQSWMSAAIALT